MKKIIKILIILIITFWINSTYACSDWWDYYWGDWSSSYENSIVDGGDYNWWSDFLDINSWWINIDWSNVDDINSWIQEPNIQSDDPATKEALALFNWNENKWTTNWIDDTNNDDWIAKLQAAWIDIETLKKYCSNPNDAALFSSIPWLDSPCEALK